MEKLYKSTQNTIEIEWNTLEVQQNNLTKQNKKSFCDWLAFKKKKKLK